MVHFSPFSPNLTRPWTNSTLKNHFNGVITFTDRVFTVNPFHYNCFFSIFKQTNLTLFYHCLNHSPSYKMQRQSKQKLGRFCQKNSYTLRTKSSRVVYMTHYEKLCLLKSHYSTTKKQLVYNYYATIPLEIRGINN